jgi:hypothetical protein
MSSNEMIVLLKPGQKIKVQCADENGELADGDFLISYGPDALTIHTDWADSTERKGEIYREEIRNFANPDDVDCQAVASPD